MSQTRSVDCANASSWRAHAARRNRTKNASLTGFSGSGNLDVVGDKAPKEGGVDRRTVITAVGVGAGVVAVGALGVAVSSRKTDPQPVADEEHGEDAPPTADAEVLALFGDLTSSALEGRWSIARLYGVHMGAIPVVLQTEQGKRFQVDILRRDAQGPESVGATNRLSLFIANSGSGTEPTDEQQGLGVIALARALARREQAGARIPALLTMGERRASYPAGIYSVLV